MLRAICITICCVNANLVLTEESTQLVLLFSQISRFKVDSIIMRGSELVVVLWINSQLSFVVICSAQCIIIYTLTDFTHRDNSYLNHYYYAVNKLASLAKC